MLAVSYLLSISGFILWIGASYAWIGRKSTPREGLAFALALGAVVPLLNGGVLLYREQDRLQQGRMMPGVVTGKLSSTGENGSRTIGRRWVSRRGRRRQSPTVLTSKGFGFDDVVARVTVSGSSDAWFVEYRYACRASGTCWRREEVRHDLWSTLQVGQTVNVLTAKGQDDTGRLDANPQWSTAFAKVAIGGMLGLLAAVLSGRLAPRRRGLVTTPAVVTSVEPTTAGGKMHWRVRFAYLTADGTAHENVDEVYVPGVRLGDNCLAVYPPDQPNQGTLRLSA